MNTQDHEVEDFERFLSQVRERAANVALVPGRTMFSPDRLAPASIAQVEQWTGTYAELIIARVVHTDRTALHEAWEETQYWLDLFLSKRDNEGFVVDGYLVLVLPTPSRDDEELDGLIAELELDTSVCRKLVLKPKQTPAGLEWNANRLSPLAPPYRALEADRPAVRDFKRDVSLHYDEQQLFDLLSEQTAASVAKTIEDHLEGNIQ